MKCERCGQVRGTIKCSLDLTITDHDSYDEGLVHGSVDLHLCRRCRYVVADQLLEFRRWAVTQDKKDVRPEVG